MPLPKTGPARVATRFAPSTNRRCRRGDTSVAGGTHSAYHEAVNPNSSPTPAGPAGLRSRYWQDIAEALDRGEAAPPPFRKIVPEPQRAIHQRVDTWLQSHVWHYWVLPGRQNPTGDRRA